MAVGIAATFGLEKATSNKFVGTMAKDNDGTYMDKSGKGGIEFNKASGQYERTSIGEDGKPKVQTISEDSIKRRGWVSGAYEKASQGFEDLVGGKSSSKSFNGSDNSSGKPSDHNPDHSVSEHQSDHGKSPNSDMSNSTTSSNSKQGTKAEIYRTEQKSKIDAAFGERALGWAGKAKGMCDSCRSGR